MSARFSSFVTGTAPTVVAASPRRSRSSLAKQKATIEPRRNPERKARSSQIRSSMIPRLKKATTTSASKASNPKPKPQVQPSTIVVDRVTIQNIVDNLNVEILNLSARASNLRKEKNTLAGLL
ncbi:hypothetical protein M422DRAFT_255400 [Sphaerobolus stellatus SS14]|uniref:Uncharacterized protein n=1 Tax=Sphaerobolus stellatus (strain SS14) TaxID=990650 RepID=A0A0C9V3K3_SPHS4|nr:hypothetical protein M422DRAFT_255400 [Sphaerobolus stellatus SS14]